MIVVLEGPDCAGKSTLATKLVGQVGQIVTNGRPPEVGQLVDHYAEQISVARDRLDALTVFDRLHVGELIYGPLFRRKAALDGAQMALLERQLDEARAVKIHVDCADAVLVDRYRKRGDALIKSEHILLENAMAYRRLLGSDGPYRGWIRVATDAGNPDIGSLLAARA